MSIPVSTMQTDTPDPYNPSPCNSLIPVVSYAHSESGKIGVRYELMNGHESSSATVPIEKKTAPHGQRTSFNGSRGQRSMRASSSVTP